AIGQALETLNVQAFEMEPAGEAYFIRGATVINDSEPTLPQASPENSRSVWGGVAGQKSTLINAPQGAAATSRIELNYTPKDVERLETEGRAKRGGAVKMADPSSLSQLLRCIGAYLTQKLARLLRISWAGDFLSVEYETSLGSRMQETLAAADLYDLWVRMYLQRASRLA
ncbi:MAG: hypothetical protein ACREQO_01185, partial [Candidatus Binatia bacterium]